MQYTFTPFPGAVAPAVLAAMAKPYSRRDDELRGENETRLKEIFFPDATDVVIVPYLREALFELVLNSFTDDRAMLICVNGPLSTNHMNTVKTLGKDFEILDVNYGSAFREAQFEKKLTEESYGAILLVEVDPYSGVHLDIAAYAALIRRISPDALILVDASASLAAVVPISVGDDADVVFAGLDGSFGMPAGLSLIAVSERANLKAFSTASKSGILHLHRYNAQADARTVFASRMFPLHNALSKQLDLLFLEGIEARNERLASVAKPIRDWALNNGFTLLSDSECASPASTVIKRKTIFTTQSLIDYCAGYGVLIGNCPDELAEDYFVIAHQNQTSLDEVETLVKVLEKFSAEYDTDLKVKKRGILPGLFDFGGRFGGD